nr:hypothetical protein A4A49_17592 [Ipomoea batatas]GME19264.1 hypothetical protein A4A49_17592 [Ipomoea batatas]
MEKKTEGRRSWSSRRRMMRSPFSTPMTKGRSSACARKTNFSLLDRLRDAVLRLIMLSALSKAATATPPPQERKSNAPQRSNDCHHYGITGTLIIIITSLTAAKRWPIA